jgi:YYY domain-containing protein
LVDQVELTHLKKKSPNNQLPRHKWVWDVLLIGILFIGAYFRFTGIKWDETYHLHPDERFLTMVETGISPIQNISQYFDTANSPLNPNNRGYTFYVYGTLPLFLVKYVGGWLGQNGYDQINVVGRVLSGLFDLGTIVFVYLIGKKLYKNARLGLLAALFSAMAVLQIQLSHYFAVDTFATFFTYAALYAAVCVATSETKIPEQEASSNELEIQKRPWWITHWREFPAYAAFGLLFGMAMACKVSIWALALLLPLGALIYFNKLKAEQKPQELLFIARNLLLAGIIAFITFRVFQPYAFMGPGFFGLKLNPNWISNLKELSNVSKGDVDVPYALQWARRPITFAWTNLTKWGLGIPLGIVSWIGFLWMGWRSFRGHWQKHLLLIFWVAFIFITQSLNPVRAMRYQLPIYPGLALIAAWFIFILWENGIVRIRKLDSLFINWQRILSVALAVITIVGTGLWAFAFTRIYTKPVTRVAASEWIYQHIPAAINLQITPESGLQFMQPVAYENSALISSEKPFIYGFTVDKPTSVTDFSIEHVSSLQYRLEPVSLIIYVREPLPAGGSYKAAYFFQSSFSSAADPRGDAVNISFKFPGNLEEGKYYELVIEVAEPEVILKIDGGITLGLIDSLGSRTKYFAPPVFRLTEETPFQVTFVPQKSGVVSQIQLNRVVDLLQTPVDKLVKIEILQADQSEITLNVGTIKEQFLPTIDPRGDTKWITLDTPVSLDSTKTYILRLSMVGKQGAIGIYNDILVMESTWDDAIPLGMFGYNTFGYETGLYGNNRNLELYWDDNEEKLNRFYSTLDQSDVILITSNRQWGTTVRVPERYPLTTEYYRSLLGCPDDKDILWCYSVAEPEMFKGKLGFELTAVFQSDPTLGNIRINDQLAEEAFTVYDHPKVLIFQKSDAYDPGKVKEILGSVDLTSVIHLTPGQASKITGTLHLTKATKEIQTAGGTWSEIFPATSPLSQNPWLAAIVWYLTISLLGIIAYPIIRIVFSGLNDRGYPFSRLAGMLLMAYFTWLVASVGGQFTRITIFLVVGSLVLLSAFLAYRQRKDLLEELKTKKLYFLTIEMLMLVLFGISLLIRLGNSDLWHPWRGGEKPMDLSYFTAVLKSTIFPPYDPWYSGGYINYYYFGFVLVGVPVKLLGIIPAIAYNLILPTLFALTGLGAFSIGWNLLANKGINNQSEIVDRKAAFSRSLNAGVLSLIFTLILGNLGTLRLISQGFQKLAAPGGIIEKAQIVEHIKWFFQGLVVFAKGSELPIGIGEWVWTPSRALPGDTITEFPFFTFTYADLHAHMIALPITIMVLGLALGILIGKWNWKTNGSLRKTTSFLITLFFGGMCIGSLRTINTWDLPTYLALTAVVVSYVVYKYAQLPTRFLPNTPQWIRKLIYGAGIITALVFVAYILFYPFTKSYAQAYGTIDRWEGDHSPLGSYLVHWGLQLFIIVTWLVWETREWLAATPASSLKRLKPYYGYLQVMLILFGLILILVIVLGIKIGWFVGLLGVWTLILLLRSDQTDPKRLVLFMIGTGLILTLFVELFVLHGDVGRMNTVFKFYYQSWTLLSLSAAAALMWLIPSVKTVWNEGRSAIWQTGLALLIISAYLYPVTAALDKAKDRMSQKAPRTLNGLTFLETSTYFDQGMEMDLSQDYHAILWMQQNVIGSPVIVETNTVEYRWGNRFTIYTGLPGVLGWNWHQRQQRGFLDYDGISARLTEIPEFYQTLDVQTALKFLKKYDVGYIIVGQMENAYYPGDGLLKFEQYDGVYWKEVFREKETVIYKVNLD